MKLHQLRPPTGSRRRQRRIGRGHGSGRGTTAGRGSNGQNSRAGKGLSAAFEGGQTSIARRLPKLRGFRNPTRVEYEVINIGQLDDAFPAGADVTLELLARQGLAHRQAAYRPLKVLGRGTLGKPLTIHTHSVSASARTAIEAAGGAVVLIGTAAAATDPASSNG